MPLSSDQQTHTHGTADLDNPLYYLENFETVVRWVRRFHSDLLTADEIGKVDGLLSLDQPARALLARMVMRTGDLFRVPADSPALHLIQHIGDASHRVAITGHRARRDKKRRQSTLEGIEGVGPKKRRDLIRYFGGIQEIRKAGVDEMAKVPGISKSLAETIYAALHDE